MAVNQTIGSISTAPQLGVDSKEVFVEKAETVWGELKLRVPELNTAFSEVNATETNINTKEATVVAKEALMSPHYAAIDAVAANEVNLNTVATDIANVNVVALDIANVNTTASNIADINTLVANIVDVNTTASNIADINTTATNIANINTAALNIADVNTVATNISNIDTVVANLIDIQNAEENAQIALDNAATCLSATNSKGAWENLTGALNTPASVTHGVATWILNNNLADVTLSEPSEVNTDWTRSGIASLFDDKAPKLGAGLDLNGFSITAGSATVSQIELGYLDGVTSSIQTQFNSKQDTLVSATNIKSLNGESLLGSGNISINATDTNVVSVAVNTTMVASTHYLVTADAKIMTLPSTPTVGDKVIVSVGDFYNTTVARNGKNIAFLAEDLKIDTNNTTVSLQYFNSTEGWRIV